MGHVSEPAAPRDGPPPLVLPVLGVPVRFESASAALRAAARAAFGEAGARPLATGPGPRIRLRLVRAVPGADEGGALEVVPRSGGRLALRQAGRIAGRASVRRMAAEARLTEAALADERAVRETLDTLTLFLLTRLDRQPVHAAAVAGPRGALVLAGASGSGKSTLAYAAMRAGLRVLTDDAVYVQLEPRPRVWGLGRPIHLAPQAVEWFPELAHAPIVARSGGKRKRAVALPETGAPGVEPAGLCILERAAGRPALEAISADEAVETLVADLDPGFDAFRATMPARIRALTRAGAWRLRLGERPHAALPALRELLGPAAP